MRRYIGGQLNVTLYRRAAECDVISSVAECDVIQGDSVPDCMDAHGFTSKSALFSQSIPELFTITLQYFRHV